MIYFNTNNIRNLDVVYVFFLITYKNMSSIIRTYNELTLILKYYKILSKIPRHKIANDYEIFSLGFK
jgi:hypothetical protein